MGSVIKKKKKTLLVKIIEKIKHTSLSDEKRDIEINIPLDDIRTDSNDIITIASRRNDLKNKKHDNSDAMVIFSGNGQ